MAMVILAANGGGLMLAAPRANNQFGFHELLRLVGGKLTAITLLESDVMVFDADGVRHGRPHNAIATELASESQRLIAGDALICDRSQLGALDLTAEHAIGFNSWDEPLRHIAQTISVSKRRQRHEGWFSRHLKLVK